VQCPRCVFAMPQHAVFGLEPAGCPSKMAHVLVYGDSLTAGWPDCVPYAKGLATACAAAGVGLKVVGCGLCGLGAEDMALNLSNRGLHDCCGRSGIGLLKLLEDELLDEGAFDLVMIMAGTNDFQACGAEEVVANIRKLHAACHQHGVQTVALGIPDIADLSIEKRRRWQAVNNRLAEWVQEEPNEKVVFINTSDLLPNNAETIANGFWEQDGIHFTEDGSLALGIALAADILPILQAKSDLVPDAVSQVLDSSSAAGPLARSAEAVDEEQPERMLLLGSKWGTSLEGPSWAEHFAATAQSRGLSVHSDLIEEATLEIWQDRLCSPEMHSHLESCSIVVLALCPSAEGFAACTGSEIQAAGEDYLDRLQMLLFILRGLVADDTRIALGGPSPHVVEYSEAHRLVLKHILAQMRTWDVDAVIDFTTEMQDGAASWSSALDSLF